MSSSILASAEWLENYLPIAIFFVVASVIACVMVILPSICARGKYNKDKLKEYECGFDAFGSTRSKFDIKFYLIAMLFIVFDVEIAFLIPWAVNLSKIGAMGFYSMLFFLSLLVVGFIYEWRKGVLDW